MALGRRARANEPGSAPEVAHESLESQLTWLWATPRSGAALMLELLAYPLRPDTNASLGFRPPPATATIGPEIIPVDEPCFAGHLAPWPGEPVRVQDSWIPGTLLNLSEGRPSYFLSRETAPVWRPLMRDLALGRLQATRERADAHVRDLRADSPLVVKESFTTHGADRVMSLLPNSRALILVRDPRDVVASQIRQPDGFSADEPEPGDPETRSTRIDRSAELWAMAFDVCRATVSQHRPDLTMRVRFEDLLAEPQREVAGVLGWMGIHRSSTEIAEAVERSSVGGNPPDRSLDGHDLDAPPRSWPDELTASETKRVESVAGSRLAEAGYPSTAFPQDT